MEMGAAWAVDMISGATAGVKGVGRPPRRNGDGGRGAPSGKKSRAFHVNQSAAENHYAGIARDLDHIRGRRHVLGRRLEDNGADADDRDRAKALQERRAKGNHETPPQGALIGEHIGSNHHFAVARARGMKDTVSEA